MRMSPIPIIALLSFYSHLMATESFFHQCSNVVHDHKLSNEQHSLLVTPGAALATCILQIFISCYGRQHGWRRPEDCTRFAHSCNRLVHGCALIIWSTGMVTWKIWMLEDALISELIQASDVCDQLFGKYLTIRIRLLVRFLPDASRHILVWC